MFQTSNQLSIAVYFIVRIDILHVERCGKDNFQINLPREGSPGPISSNWFREILELVPSIWILLSGSQIHSKHQIIVAGCCSYR